MLRNQSPFKLDKVKNAQKPEILRTFAGLKRPIVKGISALLIAAASLAAFTSCDKDDEIPDAPPPAANITRIYPFGNTDPSMIAFYPLTDKSLVKLSSDSLEIISVVLKATQNHPESMGNGGFRHYGSATIIRLADVLKAAFAASSKVQGDGAFDFTYDAIAGAREAIQWLQDHGYIIIPIDEKAKTVAFYPEPFSSQLVR
jgi:hypothetical protein